MKFTISEVFCEVVSAIGFVVAFLPLLDLLGAISVDVVFESIGKTTGTDLLSYLLIAYVLGVFLNIVGLPADRFIKMIGISGQCPDQASSKNFYQKASSDLFNYRTNAWNHYYCFRNLLTFYPFALCWIPIVYQYYGTTVFVAFLIAMAALGLILYLAVKDHAQFYSELTKTFD
jgi:hypothetical protein